MKTRVINCGKYDCIHNTNGVCVSRTTAIDKDGKCILMCKEKAKPQTVAKPKYNQEDISFVDGEPFDE